MSDSNLISITDASKHLGINRSRLNQIINKAKLQKKRTGRVALVNMNEVQHLIQQLASEGHIRTPKSHSNKKQDDYLVSHLNEEVKRLASERNELQEKIKALFSENLELRGELKLLKAAPQEQITKESPIRTKLSLYDKGKLISQILSR